MVAGEPGRNRSMKAGSGMLQRRRQGVNKMRRSVWMTGWPRFRGTV
jgi:hypothetical protein